MLSEEELKSIHGGFAKGVIISIASYVVSFIIGVFDGYYRPLSC